MQTLPRVLLLRSQPGENVLLGAQHKGGSGGLGHWQREEIVTRSTFNSGSQDVRHGENPSWKKAEVPLSDGPLTGLP